MRRNIWALGDRSVSGQLGRVMSAGDINIKDGDIKSLYSAGDVDIADSKIRKLRCAGDITAIESTFGDFKGVGDVSLKGICKADILAVIGDLSVDFLQCNVLRNFTRNKKLKVNGLPNIMEWTGDFKASTFESFYDFNLSCKYDFENIISSNLLLCQDELICENLYSFGSLQVDVINAENIFIIPKDESLVESLFGSRINISRSFKAGKDFKAIPKSANYRDFISRDEIISLTSIEGDTINIEATKAELVSGMDVVIGDLCIIERVEYRNKIRISERAIVNEVVKL